MMNYHQPKMKLSYERARELFNYDSTTGAITSRVERGGVKAGTTLRPSRRGYVRTQIDGERIYGHHLAWLLHYKSPPERMIDHRDCVRSNNAIFNLRYTDAVSNGLNRRLKVGGYLGVMAKGKRWLAYAGNKRSVAYRCQLHAALARDEFIIRNFERGAVPLNFEDDQERFFKKCLVLMGYSNDPLLCYA